MPIQHNTYIQKENHDLFFFQAEDGIRDVAVTGVQTCALPIYYPVRPPAPPEQVAHGEQVFRSNCSFCHGSDGRGGETDRKSTRLNSSHGYISYAVFCLKKKKKKKKLIRGKKPPIRQTDRRVLY